MCKNPKVQSGLDYHGLRAYLTNVSPHAELKNDRVFKATGEKILHSSQGLRR